MTMTSVSEIRPATSDDAEAALVYFSALQAENLKTVYQVDSLPTIEEEAAFLRQFETSAESVWFAAFQDDAIVGNLGLLAAPQPQRRHIASLGMSVLAPHRGVGLGTLLIETALSWAESSSLRQIQLGVLANNPRAAELYRRFKFVEYGRMPEAVLVDGEYVDLIEMIRPVS